MISNDDITQFTNRFNDTLSAISCAKTDTYRRTALEHLHELVIENQHIIEETDAESFKEQLHDIFMNWYEHGLYIVADYYSLFLDDDFPYEDFDDDDELEIRYSVSDVVGPPQTAPAA